MNKPELLEKWALGDPSIGRREELDPAYDVPATEAWFEYVTPRTYTNRDRWSKVYLLEDGRWLMSAGLSSDPTAREWALFDADKLPDALLWAGAVHALNSTY